MYINFFTIQALCILSNKNRSRVKQKLYLYEKEIVILLLSFKQSNVIFSFFSLFLPFIRTAMKQNLHNTQNFKNMDKFLNENGYK